MSLGKFAALLRAAESHPAMILYLDNQNSVGPNAAPGIFAGKGLNENLAREILELHTLGVGSGYTQADVTEFARILTGWSVAGPESEAGAIGSFLFKPNWHEPGQRTLLGKTYAEAGVEQGRAALDDLARHPATAGHIATKLVRHFVADDPPADLVDALARKIPRQRRRPCRRRSRSGRGRSRVAREADQNTKPARIRGRRGARDWFTSRPIRGSTSRRLTCSACRYGGPRAPTVFPI